MGDDIKQLLQEYSNNLDMLSNVILVGSIYQIPQKIFNFR
jgi:hypothetical protein